MESTAHSDMETGAAASPGLRISMVDVERQRLRVGVRQGDSGRTPLLLFNGIGANIELAGPFIAELKGVETIIFDVPGVGGSPAPVLPYRPSSLARLAVRLLDKLGYGEVDVLGVSWGGGVAQQFAHQHRERCRKLVLAATSTGALMVPGSPSVLAKMASPRRYKDKGYMRRIAPQIYGGAFRHDPDAVGKHLRHVKWSSNYGYYLQLLAMVGWTSLPWLRSLSQPTLVLAGSDDPLVPLTNARVLARLIPNARLEVIEDGHLFLVTRAQDSARIIGEFLAASGGA